MVSYRYKLAVGLVVVGMLIAHSEGIRSCGEVVMSLAPCINYLEYGGYPSPRCCNGVDNINNIASRSAQDRQDTCKCLQSASKHFSSINPSYAQSLPSACGLNVPYDMSPNTDCNSIN